MEYTHVEQDCYGIVVDNQDVFVMETAVKSAGELPRTQIFVYTIGRESDPATDKFARVGSPQDVQDLQPNRDDAIALQEPEYLTSEVNLDYPELTVAVQAKEALRTRINQLIKNWVAYRDNFEDRSGETQLFPTVDPDLEDSLKDNYVAARDATAAAEEDVEAADDALEDAQTELDHTLAILAIYDNELLFCGNLNPMFSNYVSQIDTEGTLAASYRTDTLQPLITSFCASAQASHTTTSNEVATQRKAVEDATTAKAEAESALAAAQAAEDAALAAVREVCPTFDPASV